MRFAAVVMGAVLAACLAGPVAAQNQTPTVSPISQNTENLPYKVVLKRVDVSETLPTLQSFALGQVQGHGAANLWVIVGGRSNGLHKFTGRPLHNFPPSKQNRRIWVIDPSTWESWSRPLSDSKLSSKMQDALSTTATESVQLGDTLYVVGGYGFLHDQKRFITFPYMTALDLPDIVDWVKKKTTTDLSKFIRSTSNSVLRVTGGQMTVLDGRAMLVFGQSFMGGYGGKHNQKYTGEVRSFDIVDRYGDGLSIENVERKPAEPNLDDFRRRDYNLLPILDTTASGNLVDAAVVQSGVFTLTNGVWTVPVEINRKGKPTMANPNDPDTFKQGMNNYNTAVLTMFDSRSGANHMLQFGGISYTSYTKSGGFVEDSQIPFINNSTVVIRSSEGKYRQILLEDARFPTITDKSGAKLYFGAESGVFLSPDVPTIGNGLVDLRKLLEEGGGKAQTIGYIFGGIAADAQNDGKTAASNEVFAIKVGPND